MRCHHIYDPIAGKVLIPGCGSVLISDDIELCTCRDEASSFEQFERQRYNQILTEKNGNIRELQSEIKRLNKVIGKLINNQNIHETT